ncbi:MAG TPA: molybdopterin-dependent oxidoreductase [Candidatus Limnocylindria bacterium]|nr:molybdopterin-dependent oxidoreductase [Candidatus Limnocylindria bacterium]
MKLRLDHRARTGALVGALSMFFALDIAFLVSLAGFAFAPDAFGQALIEITPGFIVVPLIGLLQFWAKRLLVAGVIVLFLACGGVAGALAVDPKRRDRSVLLVGALPWVATVALGQLFAPGVVDLASVLLTSAIGSVTYFTALQMLTGVATYQPARSTTERSPSRRRLLSGAAAVSAVIALGSLGGGAAVRALAKRAEGIPFIARRLRSKAAPPAALETFESLQALTPRITDNADHYTVDTTLIKPSVDVTKWTLEIGGAVETPFSLTYDQLLDLEAVEQLKTLECISNEVGGELMSTALWTGVPLRDLLARAQPKAETYDVKLTSVDGYTDSIRIEKAMEPDTIVAYLMNGVTVPQDHGYPARLLVPNIYGMKNVKWLRSIECVTFDFLGYWMERGWSDLAVINTNTRIDTPVRAARWDGRAAIPIAGVAFAGARGISKVEVSTDAGRTFAAAELEPALGSLTWVRWKTDWTPPAAGRFTIVARTTDKTGALETEIKREPFPSGATGWDSVDVIITRG